MIPLSNASRRIRTFPIITVSIIAVNFLVFFMELTFGDAFILHWSVVPAQIVSGRNWVTILTAMFLHGGWTHILGNMLFLWVFGPAIEDVMGPVRYLIFYFFGGIAATLAQIFADPTTIVPNLGASGAIAAVMGVFLIYFPRDRIRTLIFLGFFGRMVAVPAIILIGVWFLTQLFSGFGALAGVQAGSVAYMAHVGGFLFGVALGRLFGNPREIFPRLE
jgi:membrane associated rhomboid family serine protease